MIITSKDTELIEWPCLQALSLLVLLECIASLLNLVHLYSEGELWPCGLKVNTSCHVFHCNCTSLSTYECYTNITLYIPFLWGATLRFCIHKQNLQQQKKKICMFFLTEHSRIFPAAYGFMSLLFHGFLIHGARNVSNKFSAPVCKPLVWGGSMDLG